MDFNATQAATRAGYSSTNAVYVTKLRLAQSGKVVDPVKHSTPKSKLTGSILLQTAVCPSSKKNSRLLPLSLHKLKSSLERGLAPY